MNDEEIISIAKSLTTMKNLKYLEWIFCYNNFSEKAGS